MSTQPSYLSTWEQSTTTNISDDWTEEHLRVTYWKAFNKPDNSFLELRARILFVYYDSTHFTELSYKHMSQGYPWSESTPIGIPSLKADEFKDGCVPSSKGQSCTMLGRYGLCIMEASSDVASPFVTLEDFKDLIESYIDPQMADWEACYPDRQSNSGAGRRALTTAGYEGL